MDTALLRKISYYKTNKDVAIINRMISTARLNALKSDGYVRYRINKEADELENALENALATFEYRRSHKTIDENIKI